MKNGVKAKLSRLNSDKVGKPKSFDIICSSFSSYEDANQTGLQLKQALMIFSVKNRLGIDFGGSLESGGLAKFLQDKIYQEHKVKIVNSVHGLEIYEGNPNEYSFTSCNADIAIGKAVEEFGQEVDNLTLPFNKLDKRILLAIELFLSSFFETSVRSRFLTLILSAEALSTESYDRNNVAVEIINSFIEQLNDSNLDKDSRESLHTSLKHLKKESISQSLRKMAKTFLNDRQYMQLNSIDFIKKCYSARSELVHKGAVSNKYKINVLAANLEVYISDLIISVINRNSQSP